MNYKHKKTGYTAVPYTCCDNKCYRINETACVIATELVEDTQDWEPIVEKEYEVLAYIMDGKLYKMSSDPKYFFSDSTNNIASSDYLYNKGIIYTVKRLSDGCVFSVGDMVMADVQAPFKITKFIVDGGTLSINDGTFCKYVSAIKYIRHAKSLFKTEDGIEVEVGTQVYLVSTTNFIYRCVTSAENMFKGVSDRGFKYFSTKEIAEKYIFENKPFTTTYSEILKAVAIHPTSQYAKWLRDLVNIKL